MVFLEIEMPWNVILPPDQLNTKGILLQKAIILRLLHELATKKATKHHGYYIALTSLTKIGEGMVRDIASDVLFPVTFKCLTQMPCKGEILVAKADKILKIGMFLKSRPFDNIFLSEKKKGDFKFMASENPMFANEKQWKVEKDAMVRVKVLGFKWIEFERTFQMLATLARYFLGPL